MNVETGEAKEFKNESELKKALATGKWVEMERRPNIGCKHCHGRGHIGRNIDTNEYVLCKCVKSRPKRHETTKGS